MRKNYSIDKVLLIDQILNQTWYIILSLKFVKSSKVFTNFF